MKTMSLENQTEDEIKKTNLEKLEIYMTKNGFHQPMINFIEDDLSKGDLRFYIGDTSGSMSQNDGNVRYGGKTQRSTRFEEMKQSLYRSYEICSRVGIKSYFISLNSVKPLFITCDEKSNDLTTIDEHFERLFCIPNGKTPLFSKLIFVVTKLRELDQSNGKHRKLVIFTDGESTDCTISDLELILKEITEYNCSITIRLCTNEKRVISYWDEIDKENDFSLDIIDDYYSEKRAVNKMNNDLKYKYPLHALREFGVNQKKFDRIDEQKLTKVEIKSINNLYEPSFDQCC